MENMFQSLDWVDVDFDTAPKVRVSVKSSLFQSLDWVDVDFDSSLGLRRRLRWWFQSLDWVDVDFDPAKLSIVRPKTISGRPLIFQSKNGI